MRPKFVAVCVIVSALYHRLALPDSTHIIEGRSIGCVEILNKVTCHRRIIDIGRSGARDATQQQGQ